MATASSGFPRSDSKENCENARKLCKCSLRFLSMIPKFSTSCRCRRMMGCPWCERERETGDEGESKMSAAPTQSQLCSTSILPRHNMNFLTWFFSVFYFFVAFFILFVFFLIHFILSSLSSLSLCVERVVYIWKLKVISTSFKFSVRFCCKFSSLIRLIRSNEFTKVS